VPRNGFVAAALVAVAITSFAACGAGTTESSGLRAANSQHIRTYFAGLKDIVAPLHDFPRHPDNHVEATEILSSASRRLAALMAPLEFQVSHDDLLHGLLAQLDLVGQRERASRSGDTAAVALLKAEDLRQQRLIRAALAEAEQEIQTCRGDGFTC